jgi:hypothetical protein
VTRYEKLKIDSDLRQFARQHFEKPEACRNLDQVRFYIRELCLKIEEFERLHRYVPETAYSLLTQYNEVQNRLLPREQKAVS